MVPSKTIFYLLEDGCRCAGPGSYQEPSARPGSTPAQSKSEVGFREANQERLGVLTGNLIYPSSGHCKCT